MVRWAIRKTHRRHTSWFRWIFSYWSGVARFCPTWRRRPGTGSRRDESTRVVRAHQTETDAARSMRWQHALVDDEGDDLGQALTGLEVAENEGLLAAHSFGIGGHDLERSADHGCEIDLIDHQQVRACDAGPALARNLLAGRNIDDVERQIRKLGAEVRRRSRRR